MKFINRRNPILPPGYHVPDSEAHMMPDGKLYLYGSYDLRDDAYCSGEYHVVSTPELNTWEIEEELSLRGEDIPWFNNPDAPRYPGIDWSRPTPFIQKMMEEQSEEEKTSQTEKTGPCSGGALTGMTGQSTATESGGLSFCLKMNRSR